MKYIPTLRFPEFEGEWEEKKLGEIAKFTKGKGIPKKDISEDGEHLCIRYGELYTDYTEVIDKVISRTDLDIENLVLSEKNDVIIPSSGETHIDIATASCVVHGGIALGGDLNIIKTKLDGIFLAYYLNNTKKKDIAKFAQGSSVIHLYESGLKLLKTAIPPLPEQEKIASFLTTIDNKINLLKEKEEALEQYKKGIMQQLFSQELRFKDDQGNDFPDWEEKRFGDAVIKNSLKNKDQAIKNIESVSNRLGFVNQEEYFEDRRVASVDTSNYYVIKQGCFAYNPSRIDVGSIAYKKDTKTSVVSPLYISFYAKQKHLNDSFLWYWIFNLEFQKQMYSSFEGGVRNTLSYGNLETMKISIPSLAEQEKIASFLTSIDDKIALVQQELAHLEDWKRGLLQQLFV